MDRNGWVQIIAGIRISRVSNLLESKRLGSNNCRDQNDIGIKFVGIKKSMGSKLRESSQLGSKKFWHQIGGIKEVGIKSAVSNHDTTFLTCSRNDVKETADNVNKQLIMSTNSL